MFTGMIAGGYEVFAASICCLVPVLWYSCDSKLAPVASLLVLLYWILCYLSWSSTSLILTALPRTVYFITTLKYASMP